MEKENNKQRRVNLFQGFFIILFAAMFVVAIGLIILAALAGSWKLIFAGTLIALGSFYTLVILSAQGLISDAEAEIEEVVCNEEKEQTTVAGCIYNYKYEGKRVILNDGQVVGFVREA